MIRSVLYLQRNGFFFSERGLASVLPFPFHTQFVRDLDVLDRDGFVQAIGSFIETNKILPSTVLIVLSDSMLFMKEIMTTKDIAIKKDVTTPDSPVVIPPIIPTDKDESKKLFLESVPFDTVASVELAIPNGKRIVATNKELLDVLKEAFTKKNSVVEVAAPAFAVLDDSLTSFNDASAAHFLTKYDELKQHNFLYKPQQPMQLASLKITPETKQSHKREVVLVSVFSVLLLILGYMVYINFIAPAPKKVIPVPPLQQSAPLPTPTVTDEKVSSVSATPTESATTSAKLPDVLPTKSATNGAQTH